MDRMDDGRSNYSGSSRNARDRDVDKEVAALIRAVTQPDTSSRQTPEIIRKCQAQALEKMVNFWFQTW